MANPFDVFDQPKQARAPNPFDRFDGPASFDERFGGAPESTALAGDPKAAGALRTGLRAQADERLVGAPDAGNQALAFALNAGNAALLNIPRNAAAGVATAAGALGVPGYSPRSFGENYDRAKAQEEALSRQYPKTALAGTGAGLVGGAFLLPGPSGAATLTGRAVQTGAAAGGYSAASELLDTKDPTRALVAGGLGFATGYAAQPVVDAAGRVLGRWLQRGVSYRRPDGSLTDEAASALREAGVDPAQLPPAVDAELSRLFGQKGVAAPVAREASAAEFDIPLSRGQTGDAQALRFEQGAAAGRYGDTAQTVASEFTERQRAAIAAARDAAVERAGRGDVSLGNPVEAGEMVGDALRSTAARERAGFQGRYGEAFSLPGQFQPGAFERVGQRVKGALAQLDEPVIVDDVTTPVATRALADLDNIANLRLGGEPQGAGVLGAAQAAPVSSAARPVGGAAASAPALGDSIVTPSGQRIGVEYRLVDASDLRTSHTPEFRPNPAYPAELQPRDRSRAAAERQVQEIASDLKPEWLGASPSAREGAPVVGPDGLVESGNGRVMGIRRAYAEGGDSARRYREWLGSQGYDTAGVREPVLVRVRRSDLSPDDRVRFTQEANASAGLEMGAAERAASDAQRLPGRALDLYQGGDVTDAGNRDLVRAFVASLPKGEEGAAVTKAGELSLAGAQRLRNALLHRAYGDANLVGSLAEVGDDSIRAFGRVLRDLAPAVAQLREGIGSGAVAVGADLSKPLLEAAQLVQAARSRGLKLPEAVAQQDAFARLAPETDAVLRLVYGPDLTGRVNRERAVDALRGALADAGKQTEGAGLFGQGPLSAADILTAKAARGSTADAAAARGTGTPGDPIRMSAAEYRASQAAARPVVAPPSEPMQLRGVDQARRRLVAFYKAAKGSGNAADMRAVSTIIDAFDDQVERAIANGLFSGDERALKALQDARAAYASYQRTFRPRGTGDDVGAAMRRIIERDATPEEVANYLVGASRVGGPGLSARLAVRMEQVLGRDSPEWSAIRQAAFMRLTGGGEGSAAMNAARMAERINEFVTGQGSTLAKRLFSDEELANMRRLANAIRATVTPDGTLRGRRSERVGMVAQAALDALIASLGYMAAGPLGAGGAYATRIGARLMEGGVQAARARGSFEGGAARIPPPAVDLTRIGVGAGRAAEAFYSQ